MALFTNQMRMTGMSGMDVNDIVTQLMRGHSIRLDKMRQNRDIMRWQQDMLRGVTRDMQAFRNEFTIFNAPSDIRSAANFSGFRTTATDGNGNAISGVRITASGSNAKSGVQNVKIHRVASNDVFRSAETIHKGTVTGDYQRTGQFAGGGIASLEAFKPRVAVPANPNATPPTTATPAHPGGVNFQVNVNGRTQTFSLSADTFFDSTSKRKQTMDNPGWEAWATANGVTNPNEPTTQQLNNFLRSLDSTHVNLTAAQFDQAAEWNVKGGIDGFLNGDGTINEAAFRDKVQNELNSWLDTQFGRDSTDTGSYPDNPAPLPNNVNERQRVWASIDSTTGQLTFNSRQGHSVSILNGTGSHENSLGLLGFDPSRSHSTGFVPSNQSMSDFLGLTDAQSLSDAENKFTINGFTFEFRSVAVENSDPPGTRYAIYRTGPNETEATRVPSSNTTVGSEPTVQDLMSAVNNTTGIGVRLNFGANTGRFTLEGTGVGARNAIRFDGSEDSRVFQSMGFVGVGTGSFLDNPAVRTSTAQDTRIEIDGRFFERDSNNFTLSEFGLTFNLDHNAITMPPPEKDLDGNVTNANPPLNVTVTNERDTSRTMQLIKDFVDSYNQLIRSMRDLTSTRRPRQSDKRSFYMPLTDDERRNMSEREIDMWEAQARTGLLNRDQTLRTMMDELHSNIFRDVRLSGGGTINLLHLGIRTSSNLNEFGELQIDETRAANLGWWLENRLDDVTELFTRFSSLPAGTGPNPGRRDRLADSGLGQRIDDLLNWAMSTGGEFMERAGMPGTPSAEMNRMTRRIENENRRIEEMITNLQRKEARYFQTFGRLEASMMQANSQMMFLEQMFWTG